MSKSILKWTVATIGTLALTALVAPSLAGYRESRHQRLIPESRAYVARIEVVGPYPMDELRPHSIRLWLGGGPVEASEEHPTEFFATASGPTVGIDVRPSDLVSFEIEPETERRRAALGVLDGRLLQRRLNSAGVFANTTPSMPAEADELSGVIARMSREGYRVLKFDDPTGDARASGRLRHFDGFGPGSLRIYGPSLTSLAVWWLGPSVAVLGALAIRAIVAARRRDKLGPGDLMSVSV